MHLVGGNFGMRDEETRTFIVIDNNAQGYALSSMLGPFMAAQALLGSKLATNNKSTRNDSLLHPNMDESGRQTERGEFVERGRSAEDAPAFSTSE
jgi:hypothetical protein